MRRRDAITILATGLSAAALRAADRTAVRGAIETPEDGPVYLITESGKKLELEIEEADAFHTFHDPELADRTWELEGFHKDGDKFEVLRLFTIKDGKRFHVTYYCEICHIVSYRPGMCMCCQEDVELREVAEDDE